MEVIFIIFIIVIIIFIHFLSKNIDNFKNYNITKLNKLNSDLNIYSRNINFLSNNNTINSSLLCIGSECIDFNEERNKTLPKPSGNDGVCNDNQCYECTCQNGKEAVETCTKKKSQSDREQCVSCNSGYGLVNGKCVECTGDTYNDSHNTSECQSCSNLKCPTNDYPQGNPYYKRNNCGGEYKGTCSQKTCKCQENGIAALYCSTETENTCAKCNAGHKLTANAGTVGAMCVTCEANTYQSSINETTSCIPCNSCSDLNGKKRYRINCGGTSSGQCIDCPSCPDGQYRKDCGGSSEGTCVDCATCPTGKYRINCGGSSEGTCVDCPRCAAGKYRKDCRGTSDGACVDCGTCPTGQQRVDCENTSSGRCTTKVCYCDNGRAPTGTSCPNHKEEKCTSCNSGYYKNGNKCVQCTQCGPGQHETQSCDSFNNRRCAWNQCTCTNGTAAEGTSCTTDGKEQCISCKSNTYSVSNDRCVLNKIYVYEHADYGGQTFYSIGENGWIYNLIHRRYYLNPYSKNANNDISSFKKDPDAKITLYENEDGTGKCVDLTGIGDTKYIGNWWNDKISAIGFGATPCNNHKALGS